MKASHEQQLAKQVAKEFTREFGGYWKASRVMSDKVMEAMVAAGVMAIVIAQEDGIRDDGRDLAARSLYATIYREACKILFHWWKPEEDR